MSGQALAVIMTVPAAGQLLMLRHVARGRRKYNAAVINALSIVVLYAFGLLTVPFLGGPSFHDALANSGWLIFGAVAFSVNMIFMYKALEHLAVGIFSILQTMATLFTIALAVPLLHESFKYYQWVGAGVLMLTIWATLFLARQEDPHLEKTTNWKKGVLYCMISALCLALALTNEKHLLSTVSTSTYLTYEWGLQLLVAFGFAYVLGGRKAFQQVYKNKNAYRWVLGSGVMRGAGAVLFIFAQVYSNNVALVSVIANFKIILIALFGAIILKEHKFFLHKLATATMAVCGLALMIGL